MNILAIGAHWDDIEIGCSLTLKRFSDSGHTVYCVVMCTSHYESGKHHGPLESQALEQGMKTFELFGVDHYIETKKAENGRMVYDKDKMQMLEKIGNSYNIGAMFCHWFGDVNTDHQATWQIARVAFRRINNLFMYQSNAYSDYVNKFTANCFQGFDVNEYNLKLKIMQGHSGEWGYRKERWEREIFEREKFWGFLCGHDYAEGFMATKLVNNLL